jgi:hypothetical protein
MLSEQIQIVMGFIKQALIGIALYEAVKYLIKKDEMALAVPGVRNWKYYRRGSAAWLEAGSDPDAPLAGQGSALEDPWQNALADETLRAPDA